MRPEVELEWLQWHGVKVSSVEEMERLETLNLSHKGLTEFPKFEHLKSLEWLYLENNNIAEFLGNYPKLRLLGIYGNRLTKFSGNFPGLVRLDLDSNRLTKFSGKFPKLELLHVSNNKIVNFGGKYPKLGMLHLENNRLTEFSGNYSNLAYLYLQNNRKLTTFTAKVPMLRSLYIKNTKLRKEDLKLNFDNVFIRSNLLKLCAEIEKELRRF